MRNVADPDLVIEFKELTRGIPTWTLAGLMNDCTSGINYKGCTKASLSETYARRRDLHDVMGWADYHRQALRRKVVEWRKQTDKIQSEIDDVRALINKLGWNSFYKALKKLESERR